MSHCVTNDVHFPRSSPRKVVPTPTDGIPLRPWHEIASELASEEDVEKVNQLAQELNIALDQRGKAKFPKEPKS
jgi:hypothetical protein